MINRAKRIVTAFILGSCFTCPPSPARCPSVEAGDLKVGYVDVAKVFDSYERTKTSDATLGQKGKQKQAELEGRLSELKKLRESLELLNDQAREAKARQIEEKADELQRFRNSTARDLQRERSKLAKEIFDQIQQAIEEYASANGFSLILNERSLLYGQSVFDVTDEVLTLLNSRYKAAAVPR